LVDLCRVAGRGGDWRALTGQKKRMQKEREGGTETNLDLWSGSELDG